MYRIIKLSKWFALEIEDIEDDIDNINVFVDEGTPVLLCYDLEIAADFLGIEEEEIEIVS